MVRRLSTQHASVSDRNHTHPAIAQHNRATIDLAVRARNHEICFGASMLFFSALALALADRFGRAYDGGAGCYGSQNAEDHVWGSQQRRGV